MDKNEFKALVEKYKKELMQMSGKRQPENTKPIIKTVNAAEPPEGNTGTTYPENPQLQIPETYQQFLDRNPQKGYLKVQAFAAQQAIPVNNVSIKISKEFTDGEHVFFQSVTDSSGIIENISLPAPAEIISESPSNLTPYSVYDVTASHPNFSLDIPPDIQIFSDTKSILPIRLIPNNIN